MSCSLFSLLSFMILVSQAHGDVARLNSRVPQALVGFWDVELPTQLPAVAPFSNFFFRGASSTPVWADPSQLVRVKADFGENSTVLMDIEGALFIQNNLSDGLQLRHDFRAFFEKHVQANALSLFRNGTISGFFLGDELCWNGLPFESLEEAVRFLRSRFSAALLYYNEAYPIFTRDKNIEGRTVHYSHVPLDLDLVSLDFYPDEGSIEEVKSIYTTLLYPKMSPTQRALYVPPLYAPSVSCSVNPKACQRYCGDSDCVRAMVRWAQDSADWYNAEMHSSNRKLIGLNPWHWKTYSLKAISGFAKGGSDLPQVAGTWRKIFEKVLGRE